jgi:PAS domain S-box-containing protein
MNEPTLTHQEYMILTEQSPIMIWRANTSSLCDYFNQRWLNFTGRTMEQETGNGWAEGVHRDDFDSCLKTYQTSFNNREIFEMEYRLRRHDGEFRWILDRGVPFNDTNHVFAGYIGSCIDITEQVTAQEQLKHLHEAEIKTLTGLIPICASCKKIRDDKGYWEQVEVYIQHHSEATFSHGLCPVCSQKLYPEIFEKLQSEKKSGK